MPSKRKKSDGAVPVSTVTIPPELLERVVKGREGGVPCHRHGVFHCMFDGFDISLGAPLNPSCICLQHGLHAVTVHLGDPKMIAPERQVPGHGRMPGVVRLDHHSSCGRLPTLIPSSLDECSTASKMPSQTPRSSGYAADSSAGSVSRPSSSKKSASTSLLPSTSP